MTEEIWKESQVYPGYIVSSKGRVAKVKNICPTSRGYLHTKINGEKKLIHRLVAEVFIRKPKPDEQVNHIDGNPENNCVENLEWVTQSENLVHAYNTLGRCKNIRKVVRKDTETGTYETYASVAEAERKNEIGEGLLRNYIRKSTLVNTKYLFAYAEDTDYADLF